MTLTDTTMIDLRHLDPTETPVRPVADTTRSGTTTIRARAARADEVAVPPSLARRVLTTALRGIRWGRLTVTEGSRTRSWGPNDTDGPHVELTVTDPRAWSSVVARGSSGLGDAYRRGWWHTEDLAGVIRIASRNVAPLDHWRDRLDRRTRVVMDPIRRARAQDLDRDRDDIRSHYDLSNDFFATFLDPTMTYSSAMFESPDVSLHDAQLAKLERLCTKLRLGPDDHLLEIGSGWGSLAVHAAASRGCRVTTTTLSDEQHALATERVQRAGLDHLVDVRLDDYRDLRGSHDAVVSVEMIEAVDWTEHDTYFASIGRLLRPGGLAAIQAITMADGRYERAKHTVDFIKRYIFPGGCLPSVTAMVAAATRSSDLRLVDLEDFGAHYAETLRRWDTNLVDADQDGRLAALGLDDEFVRLWRFYFAYCEGAFDERHVSVVQAVFARNAWRTGSLGLRSV